jgi:hypothetical protein
MGCQGDTPAPVAPDRTLAGAPAIQCDWHKSVTDVYENKFKSDKIAACKDAAEFVDAGDFAAAELVINQLLLALYNDYAACVGKVFGTQDPNACPFADGASVVPAEVVAFAKATCGIAEAALPQTGDVDCVVPYPENLDTNPAPPTDPTDGIQGGWIVALVAEKDTLLMPNDEFGIVIDDLVDGVTEVFVAMRENEPTDPDTCPNNRPQGCIRNNYTIDADGVGQLFIYNNDPIDDDPQPGLYVEICEGEVDDFAAVSVPARCEGGTCAPSQPTGDREITGCSKGALAFAPSTWSAISAARDVRCVVTSTSAAVSEGTTCTVLDESGDPVPGKTCPTVVTEQKTSACTIRDVPAAPGTFQYTMQANKIESGVSHYGSWPFQLSETHPMFGDTLDVPVDVEPPGQ